MSSHGCNELCDLDKEFHNIQKYESEYEWSSLSKDDMRKVLHQKIGHCYELLKKLE